MLATRSLPPEFASWNAIWGAPYGRVRASVIPSLTKTGRVRRRGPFAFEPNNTTREFEYPWAYHQISAHGSRLNIVEIGGSLSGLQFVLSMDDHNVTNIDPGIAGVGRDDHLSANMHSRLCQAFNAPVRLITLPLQEAGLPLQSADVILSVSALEHFPDSELAATARHVHKLLKPGGILVMTVDLFLDCEPFCDVPQNQWGRNINIHQWLITAGFEIKEGIRNELHGYPEFTTKSILQNIRNYHVGRAYPSLAQCFVAVKSA